MNFWNGVVRWLVVVAMGVATFYPQYGVAWLAYEFFPAAPLPIAIATMIWTIALALVLPLTLKQFWIMSTLAISAISISAVWLVSQYYSGLYRSQPLWLWGVLVLFIDFGWLMVSTPLWRWARGIVATQQTADHPQS